MIRELFQYYLGHQDELVEKFSAEAFIYYVNLILPNGIEVLKLKFIGGALPDTDMLVGMDVIALCDVAIIHPKGGTTFSFRIANGESIDFGQGG